MDNTSQILTDGTERGNKVIKVGESVSIPIVFEYYLNSKQSITKTIIFELRNSIITNPINYIIEITGNYDNSLQGDIYRSDQTLGQQIISDEANN